MSAFVRCIASAAAGLLVSLAAHDARAATCTIPGFDQAAFGDEKVDIGNGCTDSYDSSVGDYSVSKCNPDPASCVAGVGTNGTSSGSIDVNSPNGCVKGGCTIGFGGSTSSISGSGQCNGTAIGGSVVTLPSVTAPTYPAGVTPASWPATITPSLSYGNLSGTGNSSEVLTLNGSGDYVIGNLNIGGQASITLTAGTKAVVYVTGTSLDLSGNGVSNTGGNPADLLFFCTDTVTSVTLTGNAAAKFAVYCPKADITINGNGALYGAVVGKSVTHNGNNAYIHYDKSLANITTTAITCPPVEVSRASPIIASLTCGVGECTSAGAGTYDAIVQGTFESSSTAQTSITTVASLSTWDFPWIKGHMRARDSASISATTTSYSAGSVLFDAAATGKIPAATYSGCSTFTGSCRQIFTNTNGTPTNGITRFPTLTSINNTTAVADLVGPMIAPTAKVPGIVTSNWQTLMEKILDAKLGGVDRSTVAVIEASTLAAAGSRPTIVYFGGTDGMLHAVCASVGGTTPTGTNICPAMGTELWAFLPRAQLPLVRTNEARVDGSVHVVDAFGDFQATQTGKRSWRTILTFQTGYTKASEGSFPAAYALDITDPANPKVVWEVTTPPSPAGMDFGTGTDAAAGPTMFNGTRTELAVLQTNNGGTSGSGTTVVALDLTTGARKWTFDQGLYPAADLVPATGMPGGAVGVDLNETGYYTDYIFADLYGRVWRVDATTGVSVTGTSTPIFKFSTLYKPIGGSPALWRITAGGALYMAFASGGYMDHEGTAWTQGLQYIAVVKVKPTSGTFPLNETAPALTGNVRIAEALTSGYGSYSSPVIVGDQLFVTVDVGNVNAATYGTSTTATGRVVSVDLNGVAASTSIIVGGGASSLATKGTTLYASGQGRTVQLSTAATSTTGQSVDATSFTKTQRNLWLRTE